MEELKQLKAKLVAERDALAAKSEPLRKQRDALVAEMQPLEAKTRELNKRIHAIERPRLAELATQIARLEHMLGAQNQGR